MPSEVNNILEQMPDRYVVCNTEIDHKIMKKFYSELSKVNQEISSEVIEQEGDLLFKNDLSNKEKQKILLELVSSGTVSAYRKIQEYITVFNKKNDPWIEMALYECQRRVEEDLVEESTGIISTGLGGNRGLLRYTFIIKAIEDPTVYEKTINDDWLSVATEFKSEIEKMKCTKKYLEGIVLLPMDVAIASLIDAGILKTNKKMVILNKNYMVTNTKIPSAEEIESFINE
jgi:hypothetical protein